ncbi:MAG: secondary thiamine-phosphate synthase enzyme YjbQ [Endomicrobiia bacterium]
MTKSFEKELSITTSRRTEFIDITEKVNLVIKESKIVDGICYLFVPHTTAGITINENADSSVVKDIIKKISSLIPENEDYTHLEGNSDSHIKSTLTGNNLTIFVSGNKLKLGTWQGIYFCEYDGPRRWNVWVKIISDLG